MAPNGAFRTLAPNVGTNVTANVAPMWVGNANVCACVERQRPANAANDGAPTRFPVSLDTGNVGTPTPTPTTEPPTPSNPLLPSLRKLGLKNQFRPRSQARWTLHSFGGNAQALGAELVEDGAAS